jgi:glutamine synthetase
MSVSSGGTYAHSLPGLEFLLGFEIEIVFMKKSSPLNIDPSEPKVKTARFEALDESSGHSWNSARSLQTHQHMLTEIVDALSNSGIDLEQWHPESANGQFEFVLPPFPPLEAVDTLLHAREIISTVVAAYGLRATLYPKPFPTQCGTASHVHISISSPNGDKKEVYEPFYAGVLRSLRAICSFTYSSPASYERMVDGGWAGGTWVSWGTQNRETPLRKILDSHWEMKCLDGLANVYLVMASIIAAGTAGVEERLGLILRDCGKDPARLGADERKQDYGIEERLPKDVNEALMSLDASAIIRNRLGDTVINHYIGTKEEELAFLNGMSAEQRKGWLIERY